MALKCLYVAYTSTNTALFNKMCFVLDMFDLQITTNQQSSLNRMVGIISCSIESDFLPASNANPDSVYLLVFQFRILFLFGRQESLS